MVNKESNFISLVVYLKENENNIGNFLAMIYKILNTHFNKYELICVSNYDNKIAKEKIRVFKESHKNLCISFITLDHRQGLEECMNAGVDLAIGDFVFEFDSCYIDYDSEIVMAVYRKALEGNDIVSAIPPMKTIKLTSKIFYAIYNHFSKMKNLTTERFRIISRRAINRVSGYNKMILYRKAIYASAGLHSAQLKYQVFDKITGELPVDIQRKNIAIDALVLFTDIAYKLSLTFSGLMALFMFGSGLYTIFAYAKGGIIEGWAPLMGLLSAGFLALFVIDSVLIKYLDLLLRLIFKKQKYMIINIDKM